MNRLPSLKFLKKTFDYNPDTGVFTRKSTGHIYKLGKGKKYLVVVLRGVCFKLHRLAYYMATGNDPGDLMVDHIDRDTTNNRLSNLRLVNRSLQNINRSNSSIVEFAGVSMTVADWARKLGIDPSTIRYRLKKGWSVSQALSTKPNPGNRLSAP